MQGFFAALIAASLAACSQSGTPDVPTEAAATAAIPTAAPTPEPFALLIAPEAPESAAVLSAVRAVEDFAAQQGWMLRRVTPGEEIFSGDGLGDPGLVAAVGSGSGQALSDAAQSRPNVRFIAVEEAGVAPLPNLLVVGGKNFRRDQAAFMAGLLVSIENSNDYVGWIGEAGTDRGKIYQNGFRHGVRYTCPRCRVFDFELAESADSSAGVSAAGQLLDDYIDTASAIPGAAGDAALATLAGNGVRVAGAGPDFFAGVFEGGTAPEAGRVLGEVAFRPDLLLAELLPRFLAGESFAEPVAYSLENGGLEYAPFPNDWISAARRNYLNDILAEVASGRLDIGVDPQTGEER
jgi:basic membrane lipoprotein Med (substrate-binding protein (PBP1-ABC) superfamily)